MNTGWRKPSLDEVRLIEKLLSLPFPGRDQLREQLKTALVRPCDTDGSLDVRTDPASPRAVVNQRVPVEGQMLDADNAPIEVLLHVVDGRLVEMEVVTFVGPPKRALLPNDLRVNIR